MIKAELRRMFLERRAALSHVRRIALDQSIADRFLDGFDLSSVFKLHSFVPISKFSEIDTSIILKRIWAYFRHIGVVAPRVDPEKNELRNFIFTSETELIESAWGIREPTGNVAVSPGEIDLVLVPLLCFDKRGNRVGYGKGYYDKFLNECRPDCLKVGLSYFPPVDEIVDIGSHDVPLDYCVTPELIYTERTLGRQEQ